MKVFIDEQSGATIRMDRYYGFAEGGGLAGSFAGYDSMLGALVAIRKDYDGDTSCRAEDLGSVSICILTGQEYVDHLRTLDPSDPDHINIYGHFEERE